MEKAEVVISDIMQEVLVQSAGQPVSGIDSNLCIRYMNRFMDSMSVYGVSLGYTKINTPSDYVTIEPGGMDGLVFNTALRLCNQYDIPVSQGLAISAMSGKSAMYQIGVQSQKASMPDTMPIGSGNEDNYGAVINKFYTGSDLIEQELQGSILLEDNTND